MRPNTRTKPSGCLDTVAMILAAITLSLGLWACLMLALGSACQDAEPYTNLWIACEYGEEMDLTPIEDELQTPTSQEREA